MTAYVAPYLKYIEVENVDIVNYCETIIKMYPFKIKVLSSERKLFVKY